VIVVVANVVAPVTPSVPPIVALPDIARLAPVIAAVTATLVNVPVVANKLVLVAFVNTPVDGVVAPTEVPLIVPPMIVTLPDVKLVIVPFVIVWLVPVAEVYDKFVPLRFVAKKLELVALPDMVALPTTDIPLVMAVCPRVVVWALNVPVATKLAVEVPPAKMRASDVVLPAVATCCSVGVVVGRQFVPSARHTALPVTNKLEDTDMFVLDTFVIVALLAVSVPTVANVALVVVASV
jgi:hypothetical protein